MANLLMRSLNGRDLHAPIRVDKRTKRLVLRLHPGEIALIDHIDLDGPAAEALVACRAGAVVNAAASISGRYPNRGPEVLLAAGIPLIDEVGNAVFEQVTEGEELIIRGGSIYRGDDCLATGREMTPQRMTVEMGTAREHLQEELHRFVQNTLTYIEEEQGLLFEAPQLPNFRVDLRDRHVLVVVRGEGARQDLAIIRGYIRDRHPIIVGVDGGADILMEAGITPDIIFGDMDSVSDHSLACGAQLIVHAYTDGRCPGKERLERLGLPFEVLPGRGTSEDVILLAIYEKGAELIIAVGSHFNLIDFLDKARSGMSSTFLVRLRVGSRLVDAKGVSRLYHVPYPLLHFSLMLITGLLVTATIVRCSPLVQNFLKLKVIQFLHLLRF